MSKKVSIETRTVGQHFATCGVIREVESGRVLAETDDVPYGFDRNARVAAETLAAKNGWSVVDLRDAQ